jgi:hypothetical protein
MRHICQLPISRVRTLIRHGFPLPAAPIPDKVRVPVASSAAFEVTWRSVRSDVVTRVLWGLPENIAADIRLVGPWRSLSGLCKGLYGLRHA